MNKDFATPLDEFMKQGVLINEEEAITKKWYKGNALLNRTFFYKDRSWTIVGHTYPTVEEPERYILSLQTNEESFGRDDLDETDAYINEKVISVLVPKELVTIYRDFGAGDTQ